MPSDPALRTAAISLGLDSDLPQPDGDCRGKVVDDYHDRFRPLRPDRHHHRARRSQFSVSNDRHGMAGWGLPQQPDAVVALEQLRRPDSRWLQSGPRAGRHRPKSGADRLSAGLCLRPDRAGSRHGTRRPFVRRDARPSQSHSAQTDQVSAFRPSISTCAREALGISFAGKRLSARPEKETRAPPSLSRVHNHASIAVLLSPLR